MHIRLYFMQWYMNKHIEIQMDILAADGIAPVNFVQRLKDYCLNLSSKFVKKELYDALFLMLGSIRNACRISSIAF